MNLLLTLFFLVSAIFCLLGRKVVLSGAQLIMCIPVIITTFMASIGFFEVGLNNIGNIATIIGICLLIGAMAKSPQIGLHVSLPLLVLIVMVYMV